MTNYSRLLQNYYAIALNSIKTCDLKVPTRLTLPVTTANKVVRWEKRLGVDLLKSDLGEREDELEDKRRGGGQSERELKMGQS